MTSYLTKATIYLRKATLDDFNTKDAAGNYRSKTGKDFFLVNSTSGKVQSFRLTLDTNRQKLMQSIIQGRIWVIHEYLDGGLYPGIVLSQRPTLKTKVSRRGRPLHFICQEKISIERSCPEMAFGD